MPLQSGSSKATISHNIEEMVKAGHPQKQAVAAALHEARDGHSDDCSITDCGLCDKNWQSTTYQIENMDRITKRLFIEDNIFIEDKNEFHAPTPVGRTRTLTPEGFLLCEDVKIARTGNQIYAARELTDQETGKPVVEPGPSGIVIIGREPEEVFRDETIKSFEGKPVTVEHPNEFVNPENWKRVAVGTTHNVHQGTGADKDFLMADLLITDKGAIDHVNRDMPQISCGYDSDYEQTEVGRGIQHSIRGNHVALVDRGRAGPSCSIRDHLPKSISTIDVLAEIFDHESDSFNFLSGVNTMPSKVKVLDRLMGLLTAVKNKDQAALDKVLTEDEEMPSGEGFGNFDSFRKEVKDWMDAMDRRMKDAFEKKEAGAEEEENRKKAEAEEKSKREAEDAILSAEELKANPNMMGRVWVGDSVSPIVRDLLSRAEILSPGVQTTDAEVSHKAVKNLMLTALLKASTNDATKALITPLLLGRKLETMDAKSLHAVFVGASEAIRAKNNSASKNSPVKTTDFGKQTTIADINKANREYWGAKK